MYYSKIIPLDMGNGPGWRTSLFVSGCRNACPGCFNPETWSFTYGQEFTRTTLYELAGLLDNPNVSGLSILGGDPFEPENRQQVFDICEYVAKYRPDKDVWVWTGYSWEDIKDSEILWYVDVLVDGKFEEDKKDLRLKWRGSSNQRVIDVRASLRSGEVVLLET